MQSEAATKLELWFFRDMLESNRLRFFELFGFKPSEMDTMMKQQMVFRRILDTLSTDVEPVESPLAAIEKRDVDEIDITGWGVMAGHAIPFAVARKLAARINLCIRSALSAQVQDVAGWQLVPKEPTQEMLQRGADSCCSLTVHGAYGVYRAMLAAASAKQEGGTNE